ncbi:MAG: ribosomal RNA small subunit methyltransferase A [Erysipelotrichaceae bacterium]|nr:ribosomal RNA small subunit methyltransferase A [Erysipelotrichaceae bacterium]
MENKAIATIARTNEILEMFKLHAKKGYGQNFIIEPRIVEKIADASLCAGGCAIEIGPGIGALSEQLCKRADFVRAYEIDERLPEVLAFSMAEYTNFEVVLQDFLTCNFDEVVQSLRDKYGKVVVCANLPYYITTPILFKIFDSPIQVDAITVMMQKEVAERFAAQPKTKDYNALSVQAQYLYDVKRVMKVPKSVFNPRPQVDSEVIRFEPREREEIKDTNAFFELVRACFKQRRKMMYNNLKEYLGADKARLLVNKAALSDKTRSEELGLSDFIHLYHCLEELV